MKALRATAVVAVLLAVVWMASLSQGAPVDEGADRLALLETRVTALTARATILERRVAKLEKAVVASREDETPEHNATEAKPFRWTADLDQIIAARNRGFQTLASDR